MQSRYKTNGFKLFYAFLIDWVVITCERVWGIKQQNQIQIDTFVDIYVSFLSFFKMLHNKQTEGSVQLK